MPNRADRRQGASVPQPWRSSRSQQGPLWKPAGTRNSGIGGDVGLVFQFRLARSLFMALRLLICSSSGSPVGYGLGCSQTSRIHIAITIRHRLPTRQRSSGVRLAA
jgi:hypothetical protein